MLSWLNKKSTHNGVYLHWNSFAPRTWKRGTLRTILIQAYKICSSKEILQNELKQIEEEFIKINGSPKWVLDQVNEECKVPRNADYDNNVAANNVNISTTNRLVLPYKGEQRQKVTKSVNNYVKRLLPQNHTVQHVHKNRRLGSVFDIKDQTKLEHKHDLTYLVKCPENACSETYLGETARRLNERIIEHADKDNKSQMPMHTLQSGHPSVSPNNFRILQKGYNRNKVKRKMSESLLIRKHRPSLNIHENSVPLELFN